MKPRTSILLLAAFAAFAASTAASPLACAAPGKGPIWTDPAIAAKESADFLLQGEYVDKANKKAIQLVALGKGWFHASIYKGGLPGAGWDKSPIEAKRGETADMKALVKGMEKVERKSPSLGAKPPEGAIILFDGSSADAFKNGKMDEHKLLESGTETKQTFGDFKLHLEFRTPFKPETNPSSQDRGNSGIYTFGRYETQVLDSFGLDFDKEGAGWRIAGVKMSSDPKQWCGCFYKYKLADVNMCLPPLAWQTYDIEFTAPRFDAEGKKTSKAKFTTYHNGIKIHDNVELPKGTGAGGGKKEIPKGPIQLQGHGNPIRYRNMWIVEKK